MTETTVAQDVAEKQTRAEDAPAGAGAVALALLDIVDSYLSAGPERSHVLSAALELAVLQPEPADISEARDEVLADHASTVCVINAVPTQRGTTDVRAPLVAAADVLRDRRLEVLDVAEGLTTPTS